MIEDTLRKAARLRRLWRSRDLTIRTSGSANGRPALGSQHEKGPYLPPYELTAGDLIRMARAARTEVAANERSPRREAVSPGSLRPRRG